MSFFSLFGVNTKEDKDLCFLRDAVLLAYSDGEFAETEKLFIAQVMASEKIDEKQLFEAMFNNGNIVDAYPKEKDEQIRYLSKLILLMVADGECSKEEIAICEHVATKMGYKPEVISSIFAKLVVNLDMSEEEMSNLVISFLANGASLPEK